MEMRHWRVTYITRISQFAPWDEQYIKQFVLTARNMDDARSAFGLMFENYKLLCIELFDFKNNNPNEK